MTEFVKIVYGERTFELPVIMGSEGEKAIDISKLRQETGLITLDPGFANTGSCKSSITFMDGEKGFCVIAALLLNSLPSMQALKKPFIFLLTVYCQPGKNLTNFPSC